MWAERGLFSTYKGDCVRDFKNTQTIQILVRVILNESFKKIFFSWKIVIFILLKLAGNEVGPVQCALKLFRGIKTGGWWDWTSLESVMGDPGYVTHLLQAYFMNME